MHWLRFEPGQVPAIHELHRAEADLGGELLALNRRHGRLGESHFQFLQRRPWHSRVPSVHERRHPDLRDWQQRAHALQRPAVGLAAIRRLLLRRVHAVGGPRRGGDDAAGCFLKSLTENKFREEIKSTKCA